MTDIPISRETKKSKISIQRGVLIFGHPLYKDFNKQKPSTLYLRIDHTVIKSFTKHSGCILGMVDSIQQIVISSSFNIFKLKSLRERYTTIMHCRNLTSIRCIEKDKERSYYVPKQEQILR